MKKILWLTVLYLIIFSKFVWGSHIAGGELTYEHVSGNTYRLTLKLYRDCNGVNMTTTADVSVLACGAATNLTLNKLPGLPGGGANPRLFPAVCSFANRCLSNNGVYGWEEQWYQGLYTIPQAACNNVKFSYQVCCRNNGITNLVNPGNTTFCVEAFLNPTAGPNNSPTFSNDPLMTTGSAQATTYNHGLIEPDGDSVVMFNIAPKNGQNSVATYSNALFNPDNPLACGNTYTLEPGTGNLSYTPAAVQVAAIAIEAREYRNGILIGKVMREMNTTVMNMTTPLPMLSLLPATLSGGILNGNTISVYSGAPLSFCMNATTANPTGKLIGSDNAAMVAAGMNTTSVGTLTPNLQTCLSWTPTLADTGFHVVNFVVKDSTCPVYPYRSMAYRIEVLPGGIPLSVDLLHFEGHRRGDKHLLKWTSSGERFNALFNLQYSKTGSHFTTVSSIPSRAQSGIGDSVLSYSCEHSPVGSGHHYYRLQAVDQEGRSTLCSKVLDLFETGVSPGFSCYPNPANRILHASVSSAGIGPANLRILNGFGQVVFRQTVMLPSGTSDFTIDLSGLSSGIYLIQLIGKEGWIQNEKIRISR